MCGEGKGAALSLRPFLHWLDKNLGELFQEALRKVKKKGCEKQFVNMLPVGKYTVYILVFLYPPSYHQGHVTTLAVTTLAVTTLSLITAIVQTPIVREMKRKMEERRKRKRRKRKRREREKERKRSRVVNPCFHLSGVQKFV